MSDSWETINELEKQYVSTVLPWLLPGSNQDIIKDVGFGAKRKFELSLNAKAFIGTPFYTPKNRFVHFTSLKALQSILNENKVRLYNLNNANDPNEYDFFINKAKIPTNSIKENTFILSLCDAIVLKRKNALNLWRLYGNEGWGVAIEFEIEIPSWSLMNYFLGRVLYKKPKITKFISANKKFEAQNSILVDFSELIHVPACFHKDPHYRIEEEIRLMFVEPNGERLARHGLNDKKFQKDINNRNEIVTYHNLELGLTNGGPKLTIKRIELGFRHSEESYRNLKIHFDTMIFGMIRAGVWQGELPQIVHSPLTNIYR